MAERVLLASIGSWTAGFVALRSSQPSRRAILGPLLGCWTYAFVNVRQLCSNQRYAGIFAWFMLFYLEHIINTLFIVEYELRDRSWLNTYYWLFNGRWIGTDFSSDKIRIRNQAQNHDANQRARPSRRKFALRRLATVLAKYAIMVVYYELIDFPTLLDFTGADFSPSKRTLIRRLISGDPGLDLLRESIIRAWCVFTWFFEDYMSLSGVHDVLAIISVGILGLDEPEDWPPLFGDLSNVTNLRTWYSQFWHLMLYRYGVNFARWILGSLLGIDTNKNPKRSRTLLGCFVFLLSGVNHLVQEWVVYNEINWMNFGWWTAQPILLAIEETVQNILMTWFPRLVVQRNTATKKLVGRIWVFAIFFWGLVKFQFMD